MVISLLETHTCVRALLYVPSSPENDPACIPATTMEIVALYFEAFIAQLGERQTEDLEVSSSILLEGTFIYPL